MTFRLLPALGADKAALCSDPKVHKPAVTLVSLSVSVLLGMWANHPLPHENKASSHCYHRMVTVIVRDSENWFLASGF